MYWQYDPANIVPQYFPQVTPGICRLVLSLFIIFPLSSLHREYVYKKSRQMQMLFFLSSGSLVMYYVLGFWGMGHCFCNILGVWVFKRLFGPSQTTIVLTAGYTMAYLIIGYWNEVTDVEVYDMLWTTPHAIHTMKLIGLIFDYRDGNIDPEELTSDQKEHAIKDFSLFEATAFCFTYTGGLTGPQMSFKRFWLFCEGKVQCERDSRGRPDSICYAKKRLAVGCLYLGFYLFGGLCFNRPTVLSAEFGVQHWSYKAMYLGFFGKLALTKYIGCWTVMEAGCIYLGISYDPALSDKWSALSSVKLKDYELGLTIKGFIDTFNITTKDWFIRYLFGRTREWGKWGSMLYTYTFIILWHGVHAGYFLSFLFEIPVVLMEKQIIRVVHAYCGPIETWPRPTQYIVIVIAKVLRFLTLGYGIQPFILLTWADSAHVYNDVYWCLHIIIAVWLVVHYICIEPFLPPLPKRLPKETKKEVKLS